MRTNYGVHSMEKNENGKEKSKDQNLLHPVVNKKSNEKFKGAQCVRDYQWKSQLASSDPPISMLP